MTTNELQTKLNDANERVEKRLTTLKKLCKKLNVNSDDLLEEYDRVIGNEFKNEFLRSVDAKSIIEKFVQQKPERDEQGKWIEENYDFNYKIGNLSDNLRKLYELQRVRENWKIKLDKETNKENMEKIPVIWNFLCDWETKTIDWYNENCKKYFELKKNENAKVKEYLDSKEFNDNLQYRFNCYSEKARTNVLKDRIAYALTENFKSNYYSGIDAFTKRIVDFRGTYIYENKDEYIGTYVYVSYTIDEELLIKEVSKEKLAKYIDLVNRITKEVGEIKNASNLSIGEQHGEINGIVEGINGKCRVETISAEGQVQKFHYRVLVHKIK